jgi:hypothetical protein
LKNFLNFMWQSSVPHPTCCCGQALSAACIQLSVLQVHLFSHGGFMYMAAVLKKLAKLAPRNAAAADVHARIAGIILDSSPASVTAGAWYNQFRGCDASHATSSVCDADSVQKQPLLSHSALQQPMAAAHIQKQVYAKIQCSSCFAAFV